MKEKLLEKKIRFQSKVFDILLRPDADESVVAEIFEWREYRGAEELIAACASPILDVGAHIGIFTLYARALNPRVAIFALEPESDNLALLRNNLAANHLEGVTVRKAALAEKTGERQLLLEPDSINHHLLAGEEEAGHRKAEKVAALTLGDFLAREELTEVGLLKMDIEGGEYGVFAGLTEEDFSRIRNVVLEYHEYEGHSRCELEETLRRHGFSVQVFPSGFEKDMGFLVARNKRNGK
jgi:FkbM family methyltransferase